MRRFRDRVEAGELLAEALEKSTEGRDVLVLALPRGGVPVAAEIAKRLQAPLDIFLVRKLGVPGYPELAMGAIASGGVKALNMEVVESIRIPRARFDEVVAEEEKELTRREKAYRDERPPPVVEGKTIILVDDGIATGSTMTAAVGALRRLHAARIVVAAPVIAASTLPQMEREADEVVVLQAPELFFGVGGFYEDFSQTSDDEVRQILAERNHHEAPAAA